jgi:DNA-binding CsgD family transcriptional regulator
MQCLGLDSLNERQKQCLRLFYANLEVKEIASEIGLSPNTVKKYLRDARRSLGVSRSMQAARILVTYEQDTQGISPTRLLGDQPETSDIPVAPTEAASAVAARNRYNLTILQRLGLILALAFGAVALAGALLVGAEAITRILVGYEIDISDPPY